MPSRLGYQPTMATELAGLQERIANTDSGAITSIQAVYVPADDFTDSAAVHTFSHLSASIVLSRQRASEGLYPSIDPLQSSSRMATPGIVGARHSSGSRRWLTGTCGQGGDRWHADFAVHLSVHLSFLRPEHKDHRPSMHGGTMSPAQPQHGSVSRA